MGLKGVRGLLRWVYDINAPLSCSRDCANIYIYIGTCFSQYKKRSESSGTNKGSSFFTLNLTQVLEKGENGDKMENNIDMLDEAHDMHCSDEQPLACECFKMFHAVAAEYQRVDAWVTPTKNTYSQSGRCGVHKGSTTCGRVCTRSTLNLTD